MSEETAPLAHAGERVEPSRWQAARSVPPRALVLSAFALAVPLIAAGLVPELIAEDLGLLLWLTALIPGFLLSYHKGWSGSALSLAGGMVVLTLSHLLLSLRGLPSPPLGDLLLFIAGFLAFSLGLGWVTELLHRERQTAEERALTDALTKLPNRRHAEVFLDAATAAAKGTGTPLSVVVFDIDRFKWLNDTHGHAAGDEALRALAALLERHSDETRLVARIGGEEFIAVLPHLSASEAKVFAEGIRQDLSKADLRWQPLTVSAGVADWQSSMPSWHALVDAADSALYRAKELGRDRVELAVGPVSASSEASVEAIMSDPGDAIRSSTRGFVVLDDPDARKALRRVLELNGLRVEEFGRVDQIPMQVSGSEGPVALVVAAVGLDLPAADQAAAIVRALGKDVPIVLFAAGERHNGAEPLPPGVVVVEGKPTGERLLPLLSRLLLRPVVRSIGGEGANQAQRSRLGADGVALTQGRIMVVDDERSNRVALRRTLEEIGFRDLAVFASGEEAIAAAKESAPDLLILDLHMPGMDGFGVLEALQDHIATDGFLPILVVTGDKQWELRQRALRMGAKDFLNKPFDVSELGARVLNLLETRQLHLQMRDTNRLLETRVRQRTHELALAKDEIIFRLARAAEYRDDVTGRHAERVGISAMILASTLGFTQDQCDVIRRAAPLHDVGKIAIPDSILLKKGPLTREEAAVMRSHTTIGADLLARSSSDIIEQAGLIALTHHERWDGGGYPRRLAAEGIPFEGRIVSLADALDALTHSRPYKAAYPYDVAKARLEGDSGTAFDPVVVEAMRAASDQLEVVLQEGE